ncbi:MAG TPA: biotin-independent malonate decarboxylase subunit beta [Chthoniobacterales bacterium]
MSQPTPGAASSSPPTLRDPREYLARKSLVELNARERAQALLDEGSYRELLGPFERLESPWLLQQGVVPQADDGLIVARGKISGTDSVILAIEGQFQGGGIGEVSGAKAAAALDLALEDAKRGQPVQVVLLLETGGVRLQEANLGLEVIAEINSSLIALRQHVPVVGVIAGMVGCFGGMSISASLCSYLIMTREARLGLNGPEVIEEQSGLEEFDSKDRQLIWGVNGGEQRHATGFADYLAEDDVAAIKECIVQAFGRGIPATHRSEQVDDYLKRLAAIDVSHQLESSEIRKLWSKGE